MGDRPDAGRRAQLLELADGRLVGYAEYGTPDAPPLVACHGLPGSRLAVEQLWEDEPTAWRVIAPDRPGIGLSTYLPARHLADVAGDVGELADALGLGRFAVLGVAVGAPHALAVAAALGDRVTAVAAVAAAGPIDAPGALEAMSPANRTLYRLVRSAPALVSVLAIPNSREMRRRPDRALDRAARARDLPASDREQMADERLRALAIEAAPEAFRQGVRGFVHEARLYVRPWGFDLAAVAAPVQLWHGELDTQVPLAMARYLEGALPRATLTVLRGEGHLVVPRHFAEVSAALAAASS